MTGELSYKKKSFKNFGTNVCRQLNANASSLKFRVRNGVHNESKPVFNGESKNMLNMGKELCVSFLQRGRKCYWLSCAQNDEK